MESQFEQLGLLPSMVEMLSPGQLRTVARAMKKALNFSFHGDRTGSDLRSSIINGAEDVIARSSDSILEDLKKEYLKHGPGQAGVRHAEETYYEMLRAISTAETETKRSKEKLNELGTSGEIRSSKCLEWINAIFGDIAYTSMYAEANMDVRAAADIVQTSYLAMYLRHALGMELTITPPVNAIIRDDATERISDLEEEDRNNRALLRERLRMNKQVVKTLREQIDEGLYAGQELETQQKRLAELETAITRDEGWRENIRNEIKREKGTRTKVKRSNRNGYIDGQGYLVLDGKNTGQRIAGTSDSILGTLSLHMETNPVLVLGRNLVVAGPNGKLVILGTISKLAAHRELTIAEHNQTRRTQDKEEGTESGSKKAGTKAPAAGTKKTGPLAIWQGLQVQYEKNPFEVLGLLPSIVLEISASEENLKKAVHTLATGLLAALHPQVKGDEGHFKEVNAAAQLLENNGIFSKALAEYKLSAPSQGKIDAIQKLTEEKQGALHTEVEKLYRAKRTEGNAENDARERIANSKAFLGQIIPGLYGTEIHPNKNQGAVYMHKAANAVLSVLTAGGARETYHITVSGFDVFGADSVGQKIRLRGSMPESLANEMAGGAEGYLKRFLDEKTVKYYRYGNELIHPTFYPNGSLFGIKDEKLALIGKIEQIDAKDIAKGNAVAQKMADGLKDKTRRPKTRTNAKT